MKSTRLVQFFLTFGTVALVSVASIAQTTPNEPPNANRQRNEWSPKPSADFDPTKRAARVTKRMTKMLGLDASQRSKVLALNTERLTALKLAIDKAKIGKDRKAFMQERVQIMSEYDKDLKGILNAEQLTKYEAMKAKAKEKMKGKRGHESQSKRENERQNGRQGRSRSWPRRL